MRLITYQPVSVEPDAFVAYWRHIYLSDARRKEDDDQHYTPNIRKDGKYSPETLEKLFRWKFGARFSKKTTRTLQEKVIPRLDELNQMRTDVSACDFLRKHFSEGGAIFRIFLLHCRYPDRFPIYDQHVHRAMSIIKGGKSEDIETWQDDKKTDCYLNDYIPFQQQLFASLDQRSIDQALWAFGKFIKNSFFPT